MADKSQNNIDIIQDGNYSATYEQVNTLITFQKLWTKLSMWLRSLLISTAEDLDNKEAVTYELYRIPTEFYNIFKVFYGPLISQQFLKLLSTFVTSARQLIEAMKGGDSEAVNSAAAQMYQTADQLAEFLSRINIYWDEDQWKYLLNQFVKLFIDETVAMLSGNYEQEIIIFNRLDDITDIMGSYMARGIIARSERPTQGTVTP